MNAQTFEEPGVLAKDVDDVQTTLLEAQPFRHAQEHPHEGRIQPGAFGKIDNEIPSARGDLLLHKMLHVRAVLIATLSFNAQPGGITHLADQ